MAAWSMCSSFINILVYTIQGSMHQASTPQDPMVHNIVAAVHPNGGRCTCSMHGLSRTYMRGAELVWCHTFVVPVPTADSHRIATTTSGLTQCMCTCACMYAMPARGYCTAHAVSWPQGLSWGTHADIKPHNAADKAPCAAGSCKPWHVPGHHAAIKRQQDRKHPVLLG